MMRLVYAWCFLTVMLSEGWMVRAEGDAPANESESTKLASGERILLLQNGKVVKGVVRQTTAGYVVNVPGGQMVLPFDQVKFSADDLEDAYRLQRSSLPERPVSAHIELARWCFTNGLPDQACQQLREVLRIEPDSTTARTMLQRINEKLLATKELPSVVARNGEFSMLGQPKLGMPEETLGGLPREAALEFAAKVQPLVVNRCATAGCHGVGSGNSFEIIRTKLGKAPPKAHSERNLAVLLELIDREQPLSSPLLTKLRSEPNSKGVRQSHGGLSREQTQTLRMWIESISQKPTPIVSVKAESKSTSADSNSKSESSRSRPDAEASDDPDDNLYRRLLRDLRSSDPKN